MAARTFIPSVVRLTSGDDPVRLKQARRSATPWRWMGSCALVLAVGPLLVLAAACSTSSDAAPKTGAGESSSAAEAALNEIGLADLRDLKVVYFSDESGIDTAYVFVLTGSPASVEAALESSNFAGDFQPGVQLNQPSPKRFHLSKLSSVQSADDARQNEDGDTFTRQVIRGRAADGSEVVSVLAFTTT